MSNDIINTILCTHILLNDVLDRLSIIYACMLAYNSLVCYLNHPCVFI